MKTPIEKAVAVIKMYIVTKEAEKHEIEQQIKTHQGFLGYLADGTFNKSTAAGMVSIELESSLEELVAYEASITSAELDLTAVLRAEFRINIKQINDNHMDTDEAAKLFAKHDKLSAELNKTIHEYREREK